MPAEFSVHVDPDELEARRLAAAIEPVHEGANRSDRQPAKPASRESGRTKAAARGQTTPQPRKYAFRRS